MYYPTDELATDYTDFTDFNPRNPFLRLRAVALTLRGFIQSLRNVSYLQ
jgi:hypothetical protein